MTIASTSLNAHERLKGSLGLCSWRAGWRSLLLRAYDEPEEVNDLVTAPTSDQLIVLVTNGSCHIEGRYAGRWHQSRYGLGDIGMTAPGEEVQLRWHKGSGLQTLQLHLSSSTLADVAHLDPTRVGNTSLPNQLVRPDPVVAGVMLGLRRAAQTGASELHAETAVTFLASHLLQFHAGRHPPAHAAVDDRRLLIVDSWLRESLDKQVTLDQLAAAAGLSKFHLLRAFKRRYGETPGQRLSRYRLEEGRRLLSSTRQTITVIAFACGYENATHFATAFRRMFGLSPTEYRRSVR
ncbi:helix-turn-helix transcriptional regulator [Rhizobium laguerreae]|uniref:helix-turn-helix domain-containing protein n=1 Tax=Rhizobium laguerreae TaxID=1076926 RepID=UPI001C907987|nr:AraC family transcriptional regulator [Rhizobium laguerreae]MBY3088886.1 helix-turn-helix transcriptional regulator [Rhizobium laguerreae]MBY3150594.1 helix-turn-helix transcriptional regulator [Rhizobium laguerreae]